MRVTVLALMMESVTRGRRWLASSPIGQVVTGERSNEVSYHQPDPDWIVQGDEPYDYRDDGLYEPDEEE